jgi:hypothetical protein
MGGVERALARKGFKVVENLSSGQNRSVYSVEHQGKRSIVKIPQTKRPLCEDGFTISSIDLGLRTSHNLREAIFLRAMEGHPMVPELFGEFRMPLFPYLDWMELKTEGVAKFVWKNGITAIHQEMMPGRKLRKGERITDAIAQQKLIDFIKDSYDRGYFNHDLKHRDNYVVDDQGTARVVDFGTVVEFDGSDREFYQNRAIRDLNYYIFE